MAIYKLSDVSQEWWLRVWYNLSLSLLLTHQLCPVQYFPYSHYIAKMEHQKTLGLRSIKALNLALNTRIKNQEIVIGTISYNATGEC